MTLLPSRRRHCKAPHKSGFIRPSFKDSALFLAMKDDTGDDYSRSDISDDNGCQCINILRTTQPDLGKDNYWQRTGARAGYKIG
jgi:hypothetical protein